MDLETFYEAALPYLKKALTKELDLHKIAEMVRTRIEVYPEITDMVSFFETLPEYDTDLFTNKKSKNNAETAAATLQALLPRIEAQETFTNDALFEIAEDLYGGKWLQGQLCDVAAACRCFRKDGDSGRRDGDHGNHRKG